MIAPFPAFDDGLGGLDYQLTGLLASELPISASCAVTTCYPIVPPDVITGITGIDRDIGFGKALFDPDFGLFRNFFAVPITGPDSLLCGYTFDPAADGSARPCRAGLLRVRLRERRPELLPRRHRRPGDRRTGIRPGDGLFDPNATEVPWAGDTYTLRTCSAVRELLQQFARRHRRPTACSAPASSSLTFNDFFSALQADAAAFVVTFNPFEPGSPVCPGACEAFGSEGPLGITLPIVQDINALTPGGNPIINEWLSRGRRRICEHPDPDGHRLHRWLAGYRVVHVHAGGSRTSIIDSLAAINPELPNLVHQRWILDRPRLPGLRGDVVADQPRTRL